MNPNALQKHYTSTHPSKLNLGPKTGNAK